MDVTPRKGDGNVSVVSAEQLALRAAKQQDLMSIRKPRKAGKARSVGKGSKNLESNRGVDGTGNQREPWSRRRPRRSFWGGTPPDQTVVNEFDSELEDNEEAGEITPMEEDSESEDWDETPNTEDRKFLKLMVRRKAMVSTSRRTSHRRKLMMTTFCMKARR